MKCVIICGPPGVGKGTQSKLLSEKFNLKHISTGEIIRNEIKSGSELGFRASKMIEGGNLLDDKTVIEISEKALENLEGFQGYILDGYPRTVLQAEAVVKYAKAHNHDILPVVCLTADGQIIFERIKKRGIRAGESENVEQEIANRLRLYEEETKPILNVFNRSYIPIDGTDSIENVSNIINEFLTIRCKDGLKTMPVD